ncbi:hypothetical protein [Fischerella sp. JS2]|nr:hypothetical protein [Fischerella sp. JS2]
MPCVSTLVVTEVYSVVVAERSLNTSSIVVHKSPPVTGIPLLGWLAVV